MVTLDVEGVRESTTRVRTSRRDSRQAALVELERLHAAILASRERRGVAPVATLTPEARAARDLTRRLQTDRPTPAASRSGEDASGSRRLWWLAAAAAILVGGAWAAASWWSRPEVVTEAAPPAPRTAEPAPAARPASSSAPAAAAPVSTRAVRVTLDTIRPVWMRVMVDGTRAIEREVAANEHFAYEGDTAIVVRVGDAGGVRAAFNGEDRGPLGRDGFPVTVRFPQLAPSPAPAAPPAASTPPPTPPPTSPPE